MSRSRPQIQQTLLRWMSSEDNPWTIWFGSDETSATQLLNINDSNPYTRHENISPEIMAYDSNIKITTEVYRVTVVLEDNIEPNADAGWWLSTNGGATKTKVGFVKKDSQAKRSHWHVYLKRG